MIVIFNRKLFSFATILVLGQQVSRSNDSLRSLRTIALQKHKKTIPTICHLSVKVSVAQGPKNCHPTIRKRKRQCFLCTSKRNLQLTSPRLSFTEHSDNEHMEGSFRNRYEFPKKSKRPTETKQRYGLSHKAKIKDIM